MSKYDPEYGRRYRERNQDKLREYGREYYLKNRDRIRERKRLEQDRETQRAYAREWYQKNRERVKEKNRQYYLKNREREIGRARRHYAANRERYRVYQQAWHTKNHHGLRPEDWGALWEAQEGLCYLCGGELTDKAVVDHDHSCCPQMYSCQVCRRGLAHADCNIAIGHAGDDPAKLRRMADALEAAQAEVAERMAAKPVQLELGGGAAADG